MFHSFIQYVGLAPTFINVLMVYAFSNLHDVSWGTKGSTTVDALPAISSDKKGEVEVIEKEQATTDQQFYETVKRTVHTEKHAPKVEREKTPQSDQDKIFRTRFVATWLGLNALVVALIVFSGSMNGDMKLLLINEGVPPGTQTLEGITGNVTEITSNVTQEALNVTLALTKKQSIYFTIILYSTAGLALIKVCPTHFDSSVWLIPVPLVLGLPLLFLHCATQLLEKALSASHSQCNQVD